MQQDLMKSLEKSVKNAVEQYVKRIVEKYDNTDEKTLLALWSDTKPSKSKPKTTKDEDTEDTTSRKESGAGCPYQFTKGDKSGTVCGVKAKSGVTYCATHKKFEGQEPKEKKVVPEPKKVLKSPPSKDTKPAFHTHKTLNILYNKDTGMVIKSAQEAVVIGKLVGTKVEDLTEEDLEICKNWRFKVASKSKVTKGKPTDSDDEEEAPAKPKGKPDAKGKVKSAKAESEDEEEEAPVKSKGKTEPKGKVKPTKAESEDEEEESPVKPKGKPVKLDAKSKSKSTKVESDDDEEEAPVKGKSVTKVSAKPAPVKKLEESDEESDEEKPAKKTTKKGKKSKDTDEAVADLDEADTKMVAKAFGTEEELSDSDQE
jgi:hypothetical protein